MSEKPNLFELNRATSNFDGNLASCHVMWNSLFLFAISWKAGHVCGDFHLQRLKRHAHFISYAVSEASIACPRFFLNFLILWRFTPCWGPGRRAQCSNDSTYIKVFWDLGNFSFLIYITRKIFGRDERNVYLHIAEGRGLSFLDWENEAFALQTQEVIYRVWASRSLELVMTLLQGFPMLIRKFTVQEGAVCDLAFGSALLTKIFCRMKDFPGVWPPCSSGLSMPVAQQWPCKRKQPPSILSACIFVP